MMERMPVDDFTDLQAHFRLEQKARQAEQDARTGDGSLTVGSSDPRVQDYIQRIWMDAKMRSP